MKPLLVCLSAFALGSALAPPSFAGSYECAGGARLLSGGRCSDGSIPVYTADTVQPHAASPAGGRGSGTIQQYQAGTIHPFTLEERRRMQENDRQAARDLARTWSPNGQPLNEAQMQAIANQRCLMMAAGNPDIRCAPR